MIPVRCFSCGNLVGDKYYQFLDATKDGEDPQKTLDKLGLKRYCCRRMIISNVDVIDLFISTYKKKPSKPEEDSK